jgi:ribosomal protein S18 acetylase RimI-like enzyme
MAFVSPIAHGNRIADVAAAIREAARRLDPAQVRIVQVLLDNGQELEAQALMAAGFGKLAHLIYMQKAIAATEAGRPLTIAPPLRRITWSDDRYDAFANAILASYEQTLDCPGLLGLRDIGDIIAGHQATGRFVPELWQTICEQPGPGRAELDAAGGGGPVAVMLLCDLPHRQALELVYLGVSVPYRGQGWARRLVEHAVHLARQRGCDKIMLAVDEHNTPALKLYRSMHFTATSRRTALIRQVKS